MSKISDLVFRYLHRALSASKGSPAQYTASGGTIRSAICANLTEANGYWIGAIVRWDSGSNAGFYSSVGAFDADTDKLTFEEDLPYAVAAGHLFTLFLGGKYASDVRIPGMKTSTPVNITGFAIDYAAMLNGTGTGVLSFKYNDGSGQTLTWTPPGETEGFGVDISAIAEGEAAVLYGGGSMPEQWSKYLLVRRTADDLPTEDALDDVSLESPVGSFLATFISAEAENGVTVYRPVAVENTAADKIYAIRVWCPTPLPDAVITAVAADGGIGTAEGVLVAEDLTGWGAHGFVHNVTKDDLRYYYARAGNSAQIMTPNGGIRGFSAVEWEDGDTLEPFPWLDIGLDAPGSGNVFEDPANENTAPSGVAFSCPRDAASGLHIGDLAAGGLHVIWERFFLPAGFLPLEAGRADLRFVADVSE
ncbi:MAG: hypothetical protein LBT97_03765 [Planctomycetota bacterium]|jgi:hypothetical protein|nr:hypothetical protein [Planctomycetota bacterium]